MASMNDIRFFRSPLAIAGLCGALLAGCGGGGVLGTGLGRSSEPGVAGTSSASNFLFYGGATVPQATSNPAIVQREYGCPGVEVLDGTAGYRIASPNRGAEGVAYQASLGQFARECAISGDRITIKVGIEGRVLQGPAGKPGTFQVPVRVAVKRGKDVVFSRQTRVSVTIPPSDTQASFTYVEEGISLPISENDPGEEYEIFVGFDPTGDKPAARTRRRS